jgi:hypothetical protein
LHFSFWIVVFVVDNVFRLVHTRSISNYADSDTGRKVESEGTMIIRNVQNHQEGILLAAFNVGVRAVVNPANAKGTAYRFTLKLGASKTYQRTSPSMTNKDGEPRRIAAVCWHGHAAFFRELFKFEPNAIVSSSRMGHVKYTAENFESTFGPTGDWNIGSHYNPVAFRDACDYDSHPCNKR